MERPSGTGPLSAEEAGNPATGCEVQPSGRNLGMEVEDAGVCGRSSVKRQRQALSSEGLVGQGSGGCCLVRSAGGSDCGARAAVRPVRRSGQMPLTCLKTAELCCQTRLARRFQP